ncbi:uncharacterized protein LOC112185617 [Rosa chinensis]|uniref:uncharacterized protein LOC112185617 n=1 Tax=Rosa chinensis TaxID=74649 RepID=UPI001AD8D149|nr:uncharacterized protein LOC112185617 [Rosa chinensis]
MVGRLCRCFRIDGDPLHYSEKAKICTMVGRLCRYFRIDGHPPHYSEKAKICIMVCRLCRYFRIDGDPQHYSDVEERPHVTTDDEEEEGSLGAEDMCDAQETIFVDLDDIGDEPRTETINANGNRNGPD